MDLTVGHCTFAYKRSNPVLDDVTVTFSRGATVLLGPNGAGKSTLLSIASGVLDARSGDVLLDGQRASSSILRRRVGWMPQQIAAIKGLRVREQIAMSAWLKGSRERDAWDRAGEALELVGLTDLQSKKATQLSGGQRARLGLAQALSVQTDVVLLDEPSAALDPDQTDLLAGLIATLAAERTVVVSTHDIHELDRHYDHVVVLDQGRVKYAGDVAEFMSGGGVSGDPVAAYRQVVSGP